MAIDYSHRLNVTLVILFLFLSPIEVALSQPKNIILFIGDGMGFEQVKAASMYANGLEGTLSFETFPYQAELTTYSADSSVTDSAAAATAMATEFKVNNGVISMAYPGDGSEMETLLEFFRDKGKSTGLVTTTYITDATPAAFGAHEPSRYNYTEISSDYLNQTLPNVLFGSGGYGMTLTSAEQAGYTVVSDREEMLSLDSETITRVSGQFGDTNLPYEYDGVGPLPHLSEMTSTALDVLDNNPNGFFLMVEGGRIDHAGYSNDIIRNIFETIEFSNAVSVSMDWAEGRTDTLIIVTADHETGGLVVIENNGKGNIPTVFWSTTDHTEINVPIYAWGESAELVNGLMDNTDLFYIATYQTNSPTATATDVVGGENGGCFIATAAYGSPMERHVKVLRKFRDRFLLTNSIGKALVDLYYTNSPAIAELIANHDILRVVVRWILLPLVGISWLSLNVGFLSTMFILLLLITCIIYKLGLRRRYHQS